MERAVASGMALALVAATVLMHYQGLRLLSARVLRDSGLRRSDILVAIFGLLLIGWSTSFTFIAMQRLWRGAD